MSHSFFAYLSRMRHIGRWGLMRNTNVENVQEHSHMVAVLAHGLAVIGKEVYHRDIDPNQVATAALYHDASEIFTGDLPTPVKYFDPNIEAAYKTLEHTAADRLLSALPEHLRGTFSPLVHERYEKETLQFVKAADKLSAYIKCVEELSAGNTEFKQAEAQIRATLEKNPLPEVAYFMEHFMPAFGLTLDELE